MRRGCRNKAQRGEPRQRYREGQEDQVGALGLVVNAVFLWNTRYMERALRQLQGYGLDVESWRKLIADLKLERFCHQLCHWLCQVRCRRICRLLCPDPPLITKVAFIPTTQINPQGVRRRT